MRPVENRFGEHLGIGQREIDKQQLWGVLLLSLAPKGKHMGSVADGLLPVTLQPRGVSGMLSLVQRGDLKVCYLFALF